MDVLFIWAWHLIIFKSRCRWKRWKSFIQPSTSLLVLVGDSAGSHCPFCLCPAVQWGGRTSGHLCPERPGLWSEENSTCYIALWKILDSDADHRTPPWCTVISTHLSWSSVFQAQSPSILALVLSLAAFLPKVLVSVPANSPLRRNAPTPCISASHKCFPHKENFFKNIKTSCFLPAIILDQQDPVKKDPRFIHLLLGNRTV